MQPLKLPSILRDAFRQIRSAPGYALVIVLTGLLGTAVSLAGFFSHALFDLDKPQANALFRRQP